MEVGSVQGSLTGLLAAASDTSDATLERLLDREELDELYAGLVRGAAWVRQMARLGAFGQPVDGPINALEGATRTILRFYCDYFGRRPVLGDPRAAAEPDVIAVLGCGDVGELRSRLDHAARLLAAIRPRVVVLSGGGFHPVATEAARMGGWLEEAGVRLPRLLLEEDSLDTLGNAVFTHALLDRENLLGGDGTRLLVVTSAFHAVRSLTIFRRVFGPSSPVAVACAEGSRATDALVALAANELQTDSRSSREIFSIEDFPSGTRREIADGDFASVLYQLLSSHDLYRHRYDLARKYGPLVQRNLGRDVIGSRLAEQGAR